MPSVNEKSMLSIAAVYACVNLLAGALSTMPINIYRNINGIREKATDHPLWWIFNESPHPTWTAAAFITHMMLSRLFHGDAFARIVRKSRLSADILHIEPLHPLCVEVLKPKELGGILAYRLITDASDKPVIIDQGDMIHITNLGFNGLRSPSTLQYALRNVGSQALAVETFSQNYYKNNGTPSVALSLPEGISLPPEAVEELRADWSAKHSGLSNSNNVAILQGGMKLEQLSITAEDAQLLATRTFQLEEICHVFGVPPHMIGHTQGTSAWGSGVEQLGIGFIKHTMARHIEAFEQEINRKIWPKRMNGYFAAFNTAGIERGDIKTRNESYRIALGRAGEPGWMTVNEIRKLENLPPIDGGDDLLAGTTTANTDATKTNNLNLTGSAA